MTTDIDQNTDACAGPPCKPLLCMPIQVGKRYLLRDGRKVYVRGIWPWGTTGYRIYMSEHPEEAFPSPEDKLLAAIFGTAIDAPPCWVIALSRLKGQIVSEA